MIFGVCIGFALGFILATWFAIWISRGPNIRLPW